MRLSLQTPGAGESPKLGGSPVGLQLPSRVCVPATVHLVTNRVNEMRFCGSELS